MCYEEQGNEWYEGFAHNAPNLDHRKDLWNLIYSKLKGAEKPHCFLGELNHTQYFDDKAGRSITIRG